MHLSPLITWSLELVLLLVVSADYHVALQRSVAATGGEVTVLRLRDAGSLLLFFQDKSVILPTKASFLET